MSYRDKPQNECEKQLIDVLFSLQDEKYREFQATLTPGLDKSRIIGVRTPRLRQLARTMHRDGKEGEFLSLRLPFCYYEEMNLYLFILSYEKDFDKLIVKIENILVYIDNWATCDTFSSKTFSQSKDKLVEHVKKWLKSDKIYTVRFGLNMLIKYYLDEAFDPIHLEWITEIDSEEYYVNMGISWYLSIALVKQYESTVSLLTEKRLKPWVHNKTIQKACESYRLDANVKAYLKSLRV